jgi:hypothetical protein
VFGGSQADAVNLNTVRVTVAAGAGTPVRQVARRDWVEVKPVAPAVAVTSTTWCPSWAAGAKGAPVSRTSSSGRA